MKQFIEEIHFNDLGKETMVTHFENKDSLEIIYQSYGNLLKQGKPFYRKTRQGICVIPSQSIKYIKIKEEKENE